MCHDCVFSCQGDQGPVGPPGIFGDDGYPVSITCTSAVVASNCTRSFCAIQVSLVPCAIDQ